MFKYIKSSFKGGSTKPLSRKGHLGSTDAAPKVPLPCPTRRDVATRIGHRCPRVPPHPATSCHMDSTWFSPTRADASQCSFDSGWFAWNQAEIQKKKVQNTPFDLILNPTSAQFHSNAKTPLLTFRLTSLSSLCLYALCLCFISLAAYIHSFFSFLSRILNSGIIIKLSILV